MSNKEVGRSSAGGYVPPTPATPSSSGSREPSAGGAGRSTRGSPGISGIPQRTVSRTAASAAARLQPRAGLLPRPSQIDATSAASRSVTQQQIDQLQALSKRLGLSFELAEASSDDEQKCRLYRGAFEDAKRAQALCIAPMLGRQRTRLEGIGVRAASGLHGVVARLMRGTSSKVGSISLRTGGTAGDQAARLALRHRMDLQLKQYADSIAELADHEQFVKATLHDLDCGLAHTPENDEVTRDTCRHIETALPYMRGAFAAFAAAAHGVRLRTYEWPNEVVQSLDAMDPITNKINLLTASIASMSKDSGTAEARAKPLKDMQFGLGRLERAADQFAQQAAEHWSADGEGPERWLGALEYVDALAAFASPFLKAISDEAGTAASSSSAEPATPVKPEPTRAEAASSGVKSSTRSRRGARSARPPATPDVTTSFEAAVRAEVLKLAEAQLNNEKRLTRDAVNEAHADPLALARKFGKDTSIIEAMIENREDPASIAHVIRDSAQSWFGSVAALHNMCRKIESLPQDAETSERLARLNERITVLQPIEARMNADESDSLKRNAYPKAKHINRLIDMREIAVVRAPVMLPSDDDDGTRGRLFELRVEPRPLSDGSTAEPLFVHVHTKQPVSEQASLSLPFEACGAIHMKSARQRTLGPRWEEIQRKLGNLDASVHRGKLKESLWAQLKGMAGRHMRRPGSGS
jgi:hypothetical protein